MKRALVAWSVVAPDYGRTCAVGDVVDLSERLPAGGTLADIVRPEWFEDLAGAEAAPARRRSSVKPAPVEPAAQE